MKDSFLKCDVYESCDVVDNMLQNIVTLNIVNSKRSDL